VGTGPKALSGTLRDLFSKLRATLIDIINPTLGSQLTYLA